MTLLQIPSCLTVERKIQFCLHYLTHRSEAPPVLSCVFSRRNATVWPSLRQEPMKVPFHRAKDFHGKNGKDKVGTLFSALINKWSLAFKRMCQFYFQRTIPHGVWADFEALIGMWGGGGRGNRHRANSQESTSAMLLCFKSRLASLQLFLLFFKVDQFLRNCEFTILVH